MVHTQIWSEKSFGRLQRDEGSTNPAFRVTYLCNLGSWMDQTRHCSAKSPWLQPILKQELFWQFPMFSDMWTALPEDSYRRHMLAHVRSSNKFTKFHMSCFLWQLYPSSMQLSEKVCGGCCHTWVPHLEAVESQVECRETQGMAEQAPSN